MPYLKTIDTFLILDKIGKGKDKVNICRSFYIVGNAETNSA